MQPASTYLMDDYLPLCRGIRKNSRSGRWVPASVDRGGNGNASPPSLHFVYLELGSHPPSSKTLLLQINRSWAPALFLLIYMTAQLKVWEAELNSVTSLVFLEYLMLSDIIAMHPKMSLISCATTEGVCRAFLKGNIGSQHALFLYIWSKSSMEDRCPSS